MSAKKTIASEEEERTLNAAPLQKKQSSFLLRTSIKKVEAGKNAPLWLITFTDVMALMLTFFVLLYSMSAVEEDKWEDISSALSSEFTRTYSRPLDSGINDVIQIDRVRSSRALDLKYLYSVLGDILKAEGLNEVTLVPQNDRLVISLPLDTVFEEGTSQVKGTGKRTLFILAGILNRVRNKIEIIGHTAPGEGNGTDWQYSLQRAASLASAFREVGYDRPLTTKGRAQGLYKTLPDTMSGEERLQNVRRVDIVVLNDSGQKPKVLEIK